MSKITVVFVLAVTLAVLFFGVVKSSMGGNAVSASSEQIIEREEQDGNVREGPAQVGAAMSEQPNIGFIDSPSATCYQPDPIQDACFINWYYLSVSAAPNYMITMTASLNAIGPVAHTQGFFQTSMYIPYNMLGRGFKVACGALGGGKSDAWQRLCVYRPSTRFSRPYLSQLRDCLLPRLYPVEDALKGNPMKMVMRVCALAGLILVTLLVLLSGIVVRSHSERGARLAHPHVVEAAILAEEGVVGAAETSASSVIDAPAPTCYRPVEHTNVCYVEWASLAASTVSPNYMISMTVSIDELQRAYTGGFFQTAMYLPADMFAPGFQVACGTPGESGDPKLGAAHTYVIRARDTTGGHAAAPGTVVCPADIVPIKKLTLAGPSVGRTGFSYPITVTADPPTATTPIGYIWQATDHTDVSHIGGGNDFVELAWDTPGTKTVTVTAENGAGDAVAVHTIEILRPVNQATLSGPAFGETGLAQVFTATAKPASATPPIAYIFGGDDLKDVKRNDGSTVTADLAWNIAGTKAVTVSVTNGVSQASAHTTIQIQDPVAGLTARNNGPSALGASTQLVARVSGGTDFAFTWTFGDGRKGTGRVVDHTYGAVGSYTAIVTASNGVSSKSATTTVIVRDQPDEFRLLLPLIGRSASK